MGLKPFPVIVFIILFSSFAFCEKVPYPIIFVHGIGDSSVAWKGTGPAVSDHYDKDYKTKDHPFFMSGSGICESRYDKNFSDNKRNSCVYVSFSDQFADPANLTGELKSVIDDTREETWRNFRRYFKSKDDVKVNLVCHSMGGLVARRYLADNFNDHHVSRLVLLGTPNKGSAALIANWGPVALVVIGLGTFAATGNPLLLSFTAAGVAWDAASYYLGGVKLSSPAVHAMKPDSKFLNALNSEKMPPDVEYAVILCNADDSASEFSNRIFGYSGGDGAISIDSQSLKYCGIPNFIGLDYSEFLVNSPHFEEPIKAKDTIIKVLDL